jgi:hypothetical protein
MAALILGLLVAAAKSAYDTEKNEVTQMAAKLVFLDRVLANYGPESADTRVVLRRMVEDSLSRIWPDATPSPISASDQQFFHPVF